METRALTHLHASHARHTRLRWSWMGLVPMSDGSGSGSSTRFFLGGWAMVMAEGGLLLWEGGLSADGSGVGFDSVAMVEGAGGVYI